MISMILKPIQEILSMLEGYPRIVLFGDSGCATICETGGLDQLEAMSALLVSHGKSVLGSVYVEGGICDIPNLRKEVARSKTIIDSCDAILVLACGVATQAITQLLPEKESFPATNSLFVGALTERFHHAEMCSLCGECILHLTGGICPIARCSKGMLNGPCGGSMDGKCERDDQTDCAWHLIYDRLKHLGKLDNLRTIWGMWDWSRSDKPRTTQQSESC
jgi:hypothetical protein